MSPSTHSVDVSQIQTDTTAILVDTGTTIPGTITTLQTDANSILVDTGTTIPSTITTLQTAASSILVDTDQIDSRVTAAVALASVVTEARLAELDAANLPTDIDAVLVDTGTTIPATITTMQTDLDELTDNYPRVGSVGTGLTSVSSSTDVVIQSVTLSGLPAGDWVGTFAGFVYGTVAADTVQLRVLVAGVDKSGCLLEIPAADGGQYVSLSVPAFTNSTLLVFQFSRRSGTGTININGSVLTVWRQ